MFESVTNLFWVFLSNVDNTKMLKWKLKGLKLIQSDSTTNDTISNDGPHKSAPLPDTKPRCSIHSSSVDSNLNEQDATEIMAT